MDSRDNEKVETIILRICWDVCKRKERIEHQGFFLSNWVDDITTHSDRKYIKERTNLEQTTMNLVWSM